MNHVQFAVENKVAKVTLNRPGLHNAFNDEMIEELIKLMEEI